MADCSKESVLAEIELEKSSCRNETELMQYKELQEIIKHIDLSILNNNSGSSERRKPSSNNNRKRKAENFEKEYEETMKQIELVKKALATVYDMENSRFAEFISRHGDRRKRIISRSEFIKRIIENGKSIPLWIGMPYETPPILCGAIEADASYVAKTGDLVAALVPSSDSENNWILAEVTGYNDKTKEYKIIDIYEDLTLEYTLNKEKVIPLPKMRADPDMNSDAIFPERALVLAMFPQTTCFYRAVVSQRPTGPDDPYQLLFEDNLSPTGYAAPTVVHQRYVINYRNVRDAEGEVDVEESEKDE